MRVNPTFFFGRFYLYLGCSSGVLPRIFGGQLTTCVLTLQPYEARARLPFSACIPLPGNHTECPTPHPTVVSAWSSTQRFRAHDRGLLQPFRVRHDLFTSSSSSQTIPPLRRHSVSAFSQFSSAED